MVIIGKKYGNIKLSNTGYKMKIINKIQLFFFMSIVSFAEVSTFVPYYGTLNYGDTGRFDNGKFYGAYMSRGNLSYLMEFSYLHNIINERLNPDVDLSQNDFTFIYSHYFLDLSYRLGFHYTNTDDQTLGDGYTMIMGISKWKWFGYDKLTYGADFYNSYYSSAHDLRDQPTPIYVHQLTPYFSFLKVFNKNISTVLEVKANFEYIPLFQNDRSYTSYEFKDTVYYQKISLAIGAFKGKMRVGIQDRGMSIINLRDIQTGGYQMSLGYDITQELNTNLSYISTDYDEDHTHFILKSSAIILNLKYTF